MLDFSHLVIVIKAGRIVIKAGRIVIKAGRISG